MKINNENKKARLERAIAIAEAMLPLWVEAFPGDRRPEVAIAAAKAGDGIKFEGIYYGITAAGDNAYEASRETKDFSPAVSNAAFWAAFATQCAEDVKRVY